MEDEFSKTRLRIVLIFIALGACVSGFANLQFDFLGIQNCKFIRFNRFINVFSDQAFNRNSSTRIAHSTRARIKDRDTVVRRQRSEKWIFT